MKPPRFEYVRPASIDEAVKARGSFEDSVILAGGQSLLPILNFRMTAPDAVIDISRIPGLDTIEVSAEAVTVGAMVRHRMLELDDAAHRAAPILREALGHVAHIPIRNRGTVCGSLAHADAAAEMPAVLMALDGYVIAAGANGSRTIPAADLFAFHMTTTLEADEIITHAVFPAMAPGEGYAFFEYAKRRGDYAQAAVCALVRRSGDAIASVRLSACGVADVPVRLTAAEELLTGQTLADDGLAAAASATGDVVTNETDGVGGGYRRKLLRTLVVRAVRAAADRATAG